MPCFVLFLRFTTTTTTKNKEETNKTSMESSLRTHAQNFLGKLLPGLGEGETVNLVETLVRDKESRLYRLAEEEIAASWKQEQEEKKSRRTLAIFQALDFDQKTIIKDVYPEFNLDFKSSNNVSHPVAAAMRKLEVFSILERLPCGPDEPIIDIGGNWYTHLVNGRANVHSCCPVLAVRDVQRHSDRLYSASEFCRKEFHKNTERRLAKSGEAVGGVTRVNKACKQFLEEPSSFFCENKVQDCTVKANFAMAIHSIYDIPLDELLDTMAKRGIKVLYCTFIFSEDILVKEKGFIPGVGAYFEKRGKKIRFSFDGDYSNGYEHDFDDYIKYVTTMEKVKLDRCWYLELLENRGGVQFLKIGCNKLHGQFRSSTSFRNIWLPKNKDKLAVKVFRYGLTSFTDKAKSLEPYYIFAPRETVRRVVEYSYKLKEEKLTWENVYNFASSVNNRYTVNGMDIRAPEKMDANDLDSLAVVVYLQAVFTRWYRTRVIDAACSVEETKREVMTGSLFSLVCKWFNGKMSLGLDSLSFPKLREWLSKDYEFQKYALDFKDAELFLEFDDFSRVWFKARSPVIGVLDDHGDYFEADPSRIRPNKLLFQSLEFFKGHYDGDNESDVSEEEFEPSAPSLDSEDPTDSTGSESELEREEDQTMPELLNRDQIDSTEEIIVPKVLERKEESLDILFENEKKRQSDMKVDSRKEYFDYLAAETTFAEATLVDGWDKVMGLGRTWSSKELKILHRAKEANILKLVKKGQYEPVLSPELSGEFTHGFDGSSMVEIESIFDEETKRWSYEIDSESNAVFVNKASRLMQSKRKLEVLAKDKARNSGVKFTLVEGVPGCGKTTDIIKRALDGDLILTVGRETAQDIRDKVGEKKKLEIRTVDSYLLNSRKRYARVWLDEGLMLCPGEIYVIADHTEAERIFVYGDRSQIPFIVRVPGFVMKVETFQDFSSYEFQSKSYRCPKDVAAVLSKFYEKGFQSASKVEKSISLKYIRNLSEVPKGGYQYLTWTQNEKRELVRKGFLNTKTIHEVQGKTYDKVCVIRHSTHKEDIYKSEPHALVALSRHRKEFIFCTKGGSGGDYLAGLVEKQNVHAALTVSQNADNCPSENMEVSGYTMQNFD